MTFNHCDHCGAIKETATIKLNKLRKKLEERQYILQHGDLDDKISHFVGEHDLWEWSQELKKALEEL
jgi:hypothetical protein